MAHILIVCIFLTARQCSYFESGTSGQVVSPGTGSQDSYFPNLNCQWTIQGNVGSRIQIQVNMYRRPSVKI